MTEPTTETRYYPVQGCFLDLTLIRPCVRVAGREAAPTAMRAISPKLLSAEDFHV